MLSLSLGLWGPLTDGTLELRDAAGRWREERTGRPNQDAEDRTSKARADDMAL